MRRGLLGLLIGLLVVSPILAHATTYYVAQSGGLDTNPGTSAQPFQTIQKCATTVFAGDTCLIRSGIYRETVTPTRSGTSGAPITFQADTGATPIINGTDVVTGPWSVYSGNIYRMNALPWNLDNHMGTNQLFVDGVPLIIARWPNTGQDLLTMTFGHADSGGNDGHAMLHDSDIPQADGFWNGGTLVMRGTDGGETFHVTSHSNDTLHLDGYEGYVVRNDAWYYLTNKLGALDAPGEWFMDGSGVYLWTWNSTTPVGKTVEVKRRPYAFNLNSRTDIVVKGLTFFAAGLQTNMSTVRIVLDGITANYPSEFQGGDRDPLRDRETGIVFWGQSNTLENSTIRHAAGSGIVLRGNNHVVFNNVFEDIDHSGSDSCGVYASDFESWYNNNPQGYGGHAITYNTFNRLGGAGIQHIRVTGMTITHNLFDSIMMQLQDYGATYTWDTPNANTEIAYNIIRNSTPINQSFNILFAIYLDDGTNTNYTIHHNLIYNIGGASRAILTKGGNSTTRIYNNTAWNVGRIETQGGSFDARNNLSQNGTSAGSPNRTAVSSDFVNISAGDFQLTAGSGAVNSAAVISGITDGFVGGAPDIGAYERGVAPWTAGASVAPTATAPTVTIASPTSQPTLQTTAATISPLSGSATDDVGVTRVDWTCTGGCSPSGGQATCTGCGATGTAVSWSVASLSLPTFSTYTITVTATDTQSLTGTDVLTVTRTQAQQNTPVWWYKFDTDTGTTATDSSGSAPAHTGTYQGNVQRTAGKVGTFAATFDGTSAITLPANDSVLPALSADHTLCFWVQVADNTAPGGGAGPVNQTFVNLADQTGNALRVAQDTGTNPPFGRYAITLTMPGTTLSAQTTGTVFPSTTTTWTHACHTLQSQTLTLYINSVPQTLNLGIDLPPATGAGANVVGAKAAAPAALTGALVGRLDEIKMWNQALSQGDIALEYGSTTPVAAKPPRHRSIAAQ